MCNRVQLRFRLPFVANQGIANQRALQDRDYRYSTLPPRDSKYDKAAAKNNTPCDAEMPTVNRVPASNPSWADLPFAYFLNTDYVSRRKSQLGQIGIITDYVLMHTCLRSLRLVTVGLGKFD